MNNKCWICGKEISPNLPSYTDMSLYCSHDQGSKGNKKGRGIEIRTCAICGKEFRARKSYPRQTCSYECRKKLQSKIASSEKQIEKTIKNGHRNKGRVYGIEYQESICKMCGKPFKYSVHKFGRDGKTFCTLACWYDYIRSDPENHPAWRGGYEPYYGPNWKNQRRLARERDNFTCQNCGITEEENFRELDVHHIKPFRYFGIKKYKQANQLDNLTTLCCSCHAKITD